MTKLQEPTNLLAKTDTHYQKDLGQWNVYWNNAFCHRLTYDNKGDADAAYANVPNGRAKILYHDSKVYDHWGDEKWWKGCV